MPRRLPLRSRLALLLAGLGLVFATVTALYSYAQRREAERVRASLAAVRRDLLERVIALRSQSLRNFATDYAQWDDMVRFVREPDRAWAAINIDVSLANFSAQAAWVVAPDGRLVYAVVAPGQEAPVLPLADPAFQRALRTMPGRHFFTPSSTGPCEVQVGAILPSDDVQRRGEPRGWFIVARRWDRAELDVLGGTMQGRTNLGTPPEGHSPSTIVFQRDLTDWRGRPIETLHVAYESAPLALILAGNREELGLIIGFGVLSIAVTIAGLSRWVLRPVRRLGESLETGRGEPLAELLAGRDEFAHLARQAAHSFVQRDALRESEEQLRQGIEVRSRLARDLHDGIIQSIYAVGLGLESYRVLQQTDPDAAARRLASCQQMLNDTLWEVRNFISALEPEAERRQSPGKSLESLVASMQQLQPVALAATVDHGLAERLNATQEIQLLQIARELLSNALRHAGARRIHISLQAAPGDHARLEVADDGAGFVPAEREAGGRGLRNITARARELGGTVAIDSAPGKGARITVDFRLTA